MSNARFFDAHNDNQSDRRKQEVGEDDNSSLGNDRFRNPLSEQDRTFTSSQTGQHIQKVDRERRHFRSTGRRAGVSANDHEEHDDHHDDDDDHDGEEVDEDEDRM